VVAHRALGQAQAGRDVGDGSPGAADGSGETAAPVEASTSGGRSSDLSTLDVPQGIAPERFDRAGALVHEGAGHISDDIAVHGSRADGTARATSDIDIAVRVDRTEFEALVRKRFGDPAPGSAKERTMLHALNTGKLQAGEAGLRPLRLELEGALGTEVDISVVARGGPFDNGPYLYFGE
jgi:hypothetical protein